MGTEQEGVDPSPIEQVSLWHQEWLETHGLRTALGAFYTPFPIVSRLVEIAIGPRLKSCSDLDSAPLIIDPSCGTGNFLIVSALRITDQLVENGHSFSEAIDHVVRHCLHGVDVDPRALDHCAANLSMLTDGRVPQNEVARHLVEVNALVVRRESGDAAVQLGLFDEMEDRDTRPSWTTYFPHAFNASRNGFDVVIGNPPFLNQLSSETATKPDDMKAIREIHGDVVSRMTNPASIFFLAALQLAAPRATVSLIQPMSFLATRDGESVRSVLATSQSLESIWVCTEKVFDADVSVVSVTLQGESRPNSVRVFDGRSADLVASIKNFTADEKTWSRAMTAARRFPTIEDNFPSTLAEICDVASDFRDQYYGLVGAVTDKPVPSDGEMRLATVGLVDPGQFHWGSVATKFAKESFTTPVVEVQKLENKIRHWAESRAVPKVIVATQTRVIECFVDAVGDVLPSVPLITVIPNEGDLWHVAAALTSPPLSLVAAQRHFGAGMSADVLKLSGRNILDLPLPVNNEAWDEGAARFRDLQHVIGSEVRRSCLHALGVVMCRAYGVEDEKIVSWWLARLPNRLR